MILYSHQMIDKCLWSPKAKRSQLYTFVALLKENVLGL